MAKKFIDAEEAKTRLRKLCAKWSIAYNENDKSSESFSGDIANFIDNLPAADVQEVRHGKWIYTAFYGCNLATVKCSRCDYQCLKNPTICQFWNY